jgi:4-aminobutyrate aminotransferase-like enzyme
MGKVLREALLAMQKRFPKSLGDVRGKGLMMAIEFVQDETKKDRTPAPEKVSRFFEECKSRGLLIGRGGLYNNTVRIAPALNVSRQELDEGIKTIEDSLAAFAD